MEKFSMKKSKKSNVSKTIRFSEELNDAICQVVSKANEGKPKKEFSFNGFVVSACEYCLKLMKE